MQNSQFAIRLAELMADRGLTQEALGRHLSISQAAVSRWLSGTVPRLQKLCLLARHMEVSVEFLLDGTGGKDSQIGYDHFAHHLEFSGRTKGPERDAAFDAAWRSANASFPGRLRWLRMKLGMPVAEFGKQCGYSASYISRLENALRGNPSWGFIQSLSGRMGISEQWIYSGEGTPFAKELPPELDPKIKTRALEINREVVDFVDSRIEKLSEKLFGTKKALTNIILKDNIATVQAEMPALIRRVSKASQERGKKAELARLLGVPMSSVSAWLAGAKEPGGEYTLRILKWVENEEGKQPKSPASASTPAEPKTRSSQSVHEKQKSSPP